MAQFENLHCEIESILDILDKSLTNDIICTGEIKTACKGKLNKKKWKKLLDIDITSSESCEYVLPEYGQSIEKFIQTSTLHFFLNNYDFEHVLSFLGISNLESSMKRIPNSCSSCSMLITLFMLPVTEFSTPSILHHYLSRYIIKKFTLDDISYSCDVCQLIHSAITEKSIRKWLQTTVGCDAFINHVIARKLSPFAKLQSAGNIDDLTFLFEEPNTSDNINNFIHSLNSYFNFHEASCCLICDLFHSAVSLKLSSHNCHCCCNSQTRLETAHTSGQHINYFCAVKWSTMYKFSHRSKYANDMCIAKPLCVIPTSSPKYVSSKRTHLGKFIVNKEQLIRDIYRRDNTSEFVEDRHAMRESPADLVNNILYSSADSLAGILETNNSLQPSVVSYIAERTNTLTDSPNSFEDAISSPLESTITNFHTISIPYQSVIKMLFRAGLENVKNFHSYSSSLSSAGTEFSGCEILINPSIATFFRHSYLVCPIRKTLMRCHVDISEEHDDDPIGLCCGHVISRLVLIRLKETNEANSRHGRIRSQLSTDSTILLKCPLCPILFNPREIIVVRMED